MAILCKDASKTFIENTEGFEIVGDVVLNSDIFIINSDVKEIKTVGMTQDRDYQIELVKERFGEDIMIVPLMVTALPYSLANGNVDAIVIDLLKGIHVDGIKEGTVVDEDYNTYQLVVNSKFKKTKDYKRFIKIYNDSLKELLEDENKMRDHFRKYTNTEDEKGGLEKWKTKLLYIKED